MSARRGQPRWPLFLIAAPAAVAVWSGWVGLGGLCGFGPVHLLPGIAPRFAVNTAITLPVGVEAYGAYALGAWLAPAGVPAGARVFARRSAVGALALGMLGQVVYHLLAAAHASRAPWPVVVLVSCLPVVTLGFGAALTHLLRAAAALPVPPGDAVPASVPVPAPAAVPAPGTPHPLALANGHSAPEGAREAADLFAAELAAGDVPSIRRIRAGVHCGQPRAREIQAHLETLTPAAERIRRIRGEIRQSAPVPQ